MEQRRRPAHPRRRRRTEPRRGTHSPHNTTWTALERRRSSTTGLTAWREASTAGSVTRGSSTSLTQASAIYSRRPHSPRCSTFVSRSHARGIELLAWAILQRRSWLVADGLGRLPAAGTARLLLSSCGIPTEVPETFKRLRAVFGRVGQPDWGWHEVLFNIRSSLVHPPKRLDEPQWPTSGELVEAWQLATWYLELAILHALGYSGPHWSRLRLGRSAWDTEPVPWVLGEKDSAERPAPCFRSVFADPLHTPVIAAANVGFGIRGTAFDVQGLLFRRRGGRVKPVNVVGRRQPLCVAS